MKKVYQILLIMLVPVGFIITFGGCNLCPNNPNGSDYQDELLISYSSQNGNNILVLSNASSFSFKEIISEIAFHSASADNGDFCYIRKNYKNSNSAMFLGNIYTKSQKLIEVENQIFSLVNPVISPKSNAIAFSGGKGQLYLWINNPTTKTTYIDKISNTFLDNSIPLFTSDGQNLVFLEQEQNNIILSIIDIKKPDEVIKRFYFYDQAPIFGQITRLSITEDRKVFFISNDEYKYYLNLIDISNNTISKNEIAKSAFQIITGEISWKGNIALLVSVDGIIWAVNLKNTNIKIYQLTEFDNCLKYVDLRIQKSNNQFIAFRTNCETNQSSDKKLYLVSLEDKNEEIKISKITYFSSNVVNAYWR